MLKSFFDKTKENVTPRFGYKELFTKSTYTNVKETESEDLTEGDFCKRYQSMAYCAWIAMAFFLGSIVQITNTSDIIGVIICVLAATLFAMFYFSYIYKLWAARIIYSHKFEGIDLGGLNLANFYDEAIVNPANMIPIKIKRKAGHG